MASFTRIPYDALNGADWSLTDDKTAARIRKVEAAGIPLGEYVKGEIYYGIKTGLSKAFQIDSTIRQRIIEQNPQSKEIIKPLLVGKDIRKWRAKYQDRWLLYTYHGIDITQFPGIVEHLEPYRQQLARRATKQEWYELQQPQMRYLPAFTKPKIMYQVFQVKPRFAYDPIGAMTNNSVFFISLDDLYLLGVLNSEPFWLEISRHCTRIQNGYQLIRTYVEKCIVPSAPATDREAIAALVQKCLDARGVGCEEWEAEIDERVAALYGL